jgi:hypothetical protein
MSLLLQSFDDRPRPNGIRPIGNDLDRCCNWIMVE